MQDGACLKILLAHRHRPLAEAVNIADTFVKVSDTTLRRNNDTSVGFREDPSVSLRLNGDPLDARLQRCLRHRGRRLWLGQGFPPFKAWRSQMASASVTTTRAPAHLRAVAQPLLTSPYPQTTDILPAIITSVALIMPSGRE
ncbi:hypothetical protein WN943_020368 [Citrus x changshan-huyou]